MKIKIPHNNEDFSVWIHPDREWLLIKPKGIKQKWKQPELWWRSMVVAPDGEVLSAGLPKFKNWGEGRGDTDDLIETLKDGGDVVFTEKLDGSLAIRSVIDGEVVWRTRGTFGTEDNDLLKAVYRHAEQYPLLMDPTWAPDSSFHFEFCHPDHQIILPVHEARMTLISAVRHADLSLYTHQHLEGVQLENTRRSDGHVFPLVEIHELPTSPDDLLAVVDEFVGREGIVARFDNEQRYVKIKSAEYLAQHRLRFAFTPRNAIEMCRQFDFETPQEFVDHLYSLGLDWEIAVERVRWFHLFNEAREKCTKDMEDVIQFVATYGDMYGTKEGSKEYARLVTEAYEDQMLRTPCFLLATGKATEQEAYDGMMDKVTEKMLKARPEVGEAVDA